MRTGLLLLLALATALPALAQDQDPAAAPVADATSVVYGQIPEPMLARLVEAELAAQRGRFEAALEIYVDLARTSGNLSVIQRTMRIAASLRESELAMEMAQLWLKQEPASIEARQNLALQLVLGSRYGEALEILADLLRDGQSVDFRLISATLARDDKAPLFLDSLIADLEGLLERFPEDQSLQLALAHLYQQGDQPRAALALIERLATALDDAPEVVMLEVELLEHLDDDKRAQRRLSQALRTHPDSKELRLRYARKLLQQRRFKEAKEQFKLITALDPRDYDTLYSLALLSMEENLYSDARDYLQQLLVNGQRVDDVHYYLGFLDGQENQPERAIEHYLQVRRGSNFMAAQRNLTELMIRAGRYNEVKTHLDNLRFRNADLNIPLLTMEANVLMDEQQFEQAAVLLNGAIGAFPDQIQLLFLRSVLSQETGDLALMEQDLRRIIQLNPSNPVAYNSLGYILADRTMRYEEAYDLIKKASELAPDDPAIIDSLGWVQYRLGKLDEAHANLTRAYALYPDPEVAAHLGEVMWMLGDTAGAQRLWRKALDTQPDSPHILEAASRLGAKL